MPDWRLIRRVVLALRKRNRETRTTTGLAVAADLSRTTVIKVEKAQPVRPDTLAALDDALGLPGGTLEALGDGNDPTTLGLPPDTLESVQRAIGPHPDGPTRNRRAV